MSSYSTCGKRVLDLVFAVPIALASTPALVAVAGAVRLSLGPPILFRQTRPGRGGRPFTVYKFRTMRDAVDSQGVPLPDDQRLTPVGTLLRRLSLDELPQLLNVLRGDMSLVGPRPLLMEYLPLYSAHQARRHDVAPGITGWAQVNGRNATTWSARLRLDVWYVDNQSFWLDAKILAKTVLAVVRRQGISAPEHATMPKFTGAETE